MRDKRLTVYDPAMCCSTGVCGSDVDPRLVRFAADLDWLAGQGVAVSRFNLAQEPGAFVEDPTVKKALDALGNQALPMLVAGEEMLSTGVYPSREQLGEWFGVSEEGKEEKAAGGGCNPKSGCC